MPNPPNRPVRLRPLREDVRTLDTDGDAIKGDVETDAEEKQDIARDGYVRTCRRPRLKGFNEMVDVDQADRLEGYMKGGTPFAYDDY